MVATGGFGAFPDNPITQSFQTVISENISADFLQPFNAYMENISAPTIQPQPDSTPKSDLDLIGTLAGSDDSQPESTPTISLDAINTSIAEFSASMTAIATLNTATSSPTSTITPTLTLIPSLTLTRTITPTPSLVWIYVSPTKTPVPDTDTPMPNMTATPSTATPPTSTPVTYLVLYDSGSTSNGTIGSRANADAFCASSLPAGFSNYNAFIGFSAADNISNLPSNYGIPTNLPIYSPSNILVANNWADLLDGSIASTLSTAGVVSNYWWSGVETNGTSTDGVTADCNDWTDSTNIVSGYYGDYQWSDQRWIKGAAGGACDQALAIVCIGY
jgi:hypothetical protein